MMNKSTWNSQYLILCKTWNLSTCDVTNDGVRILDYVTLEVAMIRVF